MNINNETDMYNYIVNRLRERNVFDDKRHYNYEMRELFQEIILQELSKTDFFENNTFMGGTALRFFHELNRYSDDLDFAMNNKNDDFKWLIYYEILRKRANEMGFDILPDDQSNKEKGIYRIKLYSKNIHQIIHDKGIVPVNFTNTREAKDVKIKMETSFHANNFDIVQKQLYDSKINTMNINSLFAGKLNALLTRTIDGKNGEKIDVDAERDWYDLGWYNKRGIEPKFVYLTEKLKECEKYKDLRNVVDTRFVIEELLKREKNLNYDKINSELNKILKKNDRINYDSHVIIDIITSMGKGGYKVKYKKDDDDWGGENSGEKLGNNKEAQWDISELEHGEEIKPMSCLKDDRINNNSIKNVMSETIEEVKNNSFENNINNNDNLRKFKYKNKNGKEIFVLEKQYHNNDSYYSIAWHFNKDFNLKSAILFVKQYGQSNINKYRNIINDTQDKETNGINIGNNGEGKGSR